jgi:hypothetical protein
VDRGDSYPLGILLLGKETPPEGRLYKGVQIHTPGPKEDVFVVIQ